MHSRLLLGYVALAMIPIASAGPPSLACGRVGSELSSVLAEEPVGTVTGLLGQLSDCFESHRICGVVYDHTQPYAHLFFGEETSDVPATEYYEAGASYALMASRSFPPSRKSHLAYCLALTPGSGNSVRPFDWHGWATAPTGEVRALDLSKEPTTTVHTNPRSMAAALWNLYARKF
jgi:hypothetical protein